MLLSAHAYMPSFSKLERIIQQATVVRQCLSEELGKVKYLYFFSFVLVHFKSLQP
ncbi:hypothetical protein Hanom_Chr05g00449521 [Helianthus anomalus]